MFCDIPVHGLEQARFHLFEDGVEHAIKYFNVEDAPVSAAIVFDARARIHYSSQSFRQAKKKPIEGLSSSMSCWLER